MTITGLEAPLANAALKPAGGIIDALIGVKIEKIKKWSKERDIEKLLEDDKLTKLIEKYIERTIHKATEISSLVFPQTKLPIFSIYENLELHEACNPYRPDDIQNYELDICGPGHCYVIIDKAGMGKSTFLKNITLRVIKETERVPILFELSLYNGESSLVENLASLFDELNHEFSRELFSKLIVAGKFLIILDGYDELPGTHQNRIKYEITELNDKKQKSTLIVSTRPQPNLPNLINSTILGLKKFSKRQAESLVLKYDKFANLNIGARIIAEFDKIPERFLETPLLVGLLYRTFGFNNSIANKISVFYIEIFDALYKGHDLTKSGFVREKKSGLDIDDFKSLLRALSFHHILNSKSGVQSEESIVSLIEKAQSLCNNKPSSPRAFYDDLLSAVPILTKDGNQIKFMHRTIAEYFAAEFIVSSKDPSNLIEKIIKSPASTNFSQAIEFVYEIAPCIYNESITLPIATRYIKQYEHFEENNIYHNVLFSGKSYISYWKYNDVSRKENGRKTIHLPHKPLTNGSTAYLYGNINDTRYVVCISLGTTYTIPPNARRELLDPYKTDHLGVSTSRVDDLNIREIADILDIGVWYETNSTLISTNSWRSSFIEIFCRAIPPPPSMIENSIITTEHIHVITLDSCRRLSTSMDSIIRARHNLESLL